MKKLSLFVFAFATALAISPAANADSFNFSVSGSGFTGSGILTGTSIGSSMTAITSGTFTINGVSGSIVGNPNMPGVAIYNAGAGYNYDYDDIVFSAGGKQSLDVDGLLFLLSNGGAVNIWELGGTYYWNEWLGNAWLFNPAIGEGGEPINGSISPTPEPSSLLLLGTGLLLLAGFIYRESVREACESPVAKAA